MDRNPVFLTEAVANLAIDSVFNMVFGSPGLSMLLKRQTCHVVVAVRNSEGALEILSEKDYGDREKWEYQFDEIALGKFALFATGRHDGRTAPLPHLLFPGDTPYWGGVEYEGLVVTCSGIQPWFDRMISGMIAHMCVALTHDAFELAKANGGLPDILE